MKAFDVLSNIVYAPLKISDPTDGEERISAIEGTPEIVYIFLDFIAPQNYHKKKYYHIHRLPVGSRLDEWVYKHLVEQEQFARYLDRYRERKGINSDNIDQYILRKHYYPKAFRVLKKKKNFHLAAWSKPRRQFSYERKSNLFLKTGEEIPFDFRNVIQVFFTVKHSADRFILSEGGSGSSGQRENNTLFTAIYHLVSKRKPVRYYLIKYNGDNQFEYIRCSRKILLTDGFGSNYDLDKSLRLEIEKAGIDWYKIPQLKRG